MVVLVVAGLAAAAHADHMEGRGTFESDPYDKYVLGNKAEAISEHQGLTATGLDVEGSKAAWVIPDAVSSNQCAAIGPPSSPGSIWQVDMMFAFEACETRSLSLRFMDHTGGEIYLRVAGDRTLRVASPTSSQNRLGGDLLLEPSVDADGNHSFADEGDTLNVYSLRVVGRYDSDTPEYDVYLSDANSSTLHLLAENLTYFAKADRIPEEGAKFQRVIFYGDGADGGAVVDNIIVTVPEPATLGLIGIGGMLALARRNRK